MSKGKYLIFIAVLFLTSCIVSFNGYELQPKNYVINKDFNEIMFDIDFINTKQEMINNLQKAYTHHANCESVEKTHDAKLFSKVELFGFILGPEYSELKNSQTDSLTGSIRLCRYHNSSDCIQEKFKQKRYTFKCVAAFYEGMDRGYRSKPFVIDFDTRTLKKEL